MFKIFLSIGLGILIGYRNMLSPKAIKWNSRLQNVWLLLLIFVMGMSIGMDGDILKQLPVLGGKALLFAVATIIGSVLVVYIVSSAFFEREGHK